MDRENDLVTILSKDFGNNNWKRQRESFFGQDLQDEQDLRASFQACPHAQHPVNHVHPV